MDKPKFNLIDALIILLVIVVAVVAVYFVKGIGTSANDKSNNTTVEFKLQLTGAPYSLYEKIIKANETDKSVWVGVKERFEGELVSVEALPSTKITTNLRTGDAILAEDPTTFDINLTIKAPATETDSAISASGTELRVGKEETVRGMGYAGYGFIIDIKTSPLD